MQIEKFINFYRDKYIRGLPTVRLFDNDENYFIQELRTSPKKTFIFTKYMKMENRRIRAGVITSLEETKVYSLQLIFETV